MNLNGTALLVMRGASVALRDAMAAGAALKAVVLRPLSHLAIWVKREQRERE